MKLKQKVSRKKTAPRNSCCGNGAFIKLRVLPYGSPVRRKGGISKTVKA